MQSKEHLDAISIVLGITREEAKKNIKIIETTAKVSEMIDKELSKAASEIGTEKTTLEMMTISKVLEKYSTEDKDILIRGLHKVIIKEAVKRMEKAKKIQEIERELVDTSTRNTGESTK